MNKKQTLPLVLSGIVTRFKGDGRRLGYPTANLAVETGAVDGVYFGFADMAGFHRHPSIIFVGVPTTTGETRRRVEAHLFDIPDEDYYGQHLELSLDYFYRPNRTFADVGELQQVMRADETAARRWFAGGQADTAQTGETGRGGSP
jgi:riboflavin kinase/FMN adenylyltransferase